MIKEQNMFDVFAMIEDYCDPLIERIPLLKKSKLVLPSLSKFKISVVP